MKLLDFGSAAPFSKPCTDMAGTMPFMAPEILSAADKDPYIPSGCDMWATAVALLEMLCGFGKLNKMLNWGPRPKPSPQRSEELRIFFKDTRTPPRPRFPPPHPPHPLLLERVVSALVVASDIDSTCGKSALALRCSRRRSGRVLLLFCDYRFQLVASRRWKISNRTERAVLHVQLALSYISS